MYKTSTLLMLRMLGNMGLALEDRSCPLCPHCELYTITVLNDLRLPWTYHLASVSAPSVPWFGMTLVVPFPLPLGELLITHPSVLRRLYGGCNELPSLTDSPSTVLLLYLTLLSISSHRTVCISIFSTRLRGPYGQGPWPYSFPVSIT